MQKNNATGYGELPLNLQWSYKSTPFIRKFWWYSWAELPILGFIEYLAACASSPEIWFLAVHDMMTPLLATAIKIYSPDQKVRKS